MSDWKIFRNTGSYHLGIENLPDPPRWRDFQRKGEERGKIFVAPPGTEDMVNAALYLRRPLLVTGKPGTGKTSLAYAIATELGLGEVLYWPIGTRTTLEEGLYRYDAIARVQDAGPSEDNLREIGNYIQLGPVGSALLPREIPRILLIDEIDKSDIDLPNNLLHVFEEGRFRIKELERIKARVNPVRVSTAYLDDEEDKTAEISDGVVKCQQFPLVILTSNGERDFPPAFLRRCLRLDMAQPGKEALARIVREYLGEAAIAKTEGIIDKFLSKQQTEILATDQLLNAIFLIVEQDFDEETRDRLVEQLLRNLSCQ